MKRLLLTTAAIAGLAIVPALAQTMGTSSSGTAPTTRTSPCVSSNAGPAATNIDRSGTGSGGNKPGTTQSSEATGSSLSHAGSGTAPNTASSATGCQ